MVLVYKVFNNHLSAALLGRSPVLKISQYTLNILLRGFWCAGTSVPSALGLVSPLTDTQLPLGFTWAPKHLSRTLRKKRKNPKTSRTARKHELDSRWQLWGSKGGEFPLHSSSSGGHLGSIEGVQHFNYSGFPFWISKAAQWMQGENIHEMKGQWCGDETESQKEPKWPEQKPSPCPTPPSAARAATSAKTCISGRESQKSLSCKHQFITKAQKDFGRGGTREKETLRSSGSTPASKLPNVFPLQLKIFLEEKSGK